MAGWSTDALIVGGGPAGLATALALRRRGIPCVVAEARPPSIDKACGEGLMPSAVQALARLGVQVEAADGQMFRGICFESAAGRAEADFPGMCGVGVRRLRLHARMAEAVEAAGVPVLWGAGVQLAGPGVALVDGEPVGFRYLVGADGQSSSVRGWAGLGECAKLRVRYGFRRHYRVTPWTDRVEVHWGDFGQIYVTPVAPDCVGIAYVSRDQHYDHETVMAEFPEIAVRIEGAEQVSEQRGAVSATRILREVARGTVALVGDASGSVDAVTGEGLSLAFLQAEALADALVRGDLEAYGRAHRRIGGLAHRMSSLMLLMDSFPGLAEKAIRTLAARPEFFRELLAVHVGARPMARFAVERGPQFCWHLLTA